MTSRRSPARCTRSSSAAIRTSSATRSPTRPAGCASGGRRSRPSRRAARASSTTFPRRCPGCSTRARCSAGRPPSGSTGPTSTAPLAKMREELGEVDAELERAGRPAPETEPDPRVFAELGDLLFTVVNVARARQRRPGARPARDERAASSRASSSPSSSRPTPGETWAELDLEAQERWYDRGEEPARRLEAASAGVGQPAARFRRQG